MSVTTLTYSNDKRTPGWPSFYSYIPDYMKGLNGFFYTFKNGELYRHNTNETRNNYYNVQYSSSIKSVFNPEPTLSIKLFKTMSYESDDKWSVTLTTDLNAGSMLGTYFEQKEGEWFTYIRSNSGAVNWKLRSAQGIGIAQAVSGPTSAREIKFAEPIGNIVNIGDIVYVSTNNGGVYTTPVLASAIIAKTSNSITIDVSQNPPPVPPLANPQAGDAILAYKDSVAESNGARGYYMEFNMTNDSTSAVELFSVGSSVMKSYP
tara:strand:+ start:7693 stop:8478 length:786 start_codon:yes stop_codon:yes gene_type:complete